MKFDPIDLDICDVRIYRSSQYSSYEEANKFGGLYVLSLTKGYTDTSNSLINSCVTAECVQHNSARKDIRAVIHVNGKRLEECFLTDAQETIDKYLASIYRRPVERQVA